jgi:hypothetical protein
VDNPPWNRQRAFPNSTLTKQVPPARVMTLVRNKTLAVDFAKYDVKRAEYRRDIGKHMSASQEIHCRQMGE